MVTCWGYRVDKTKLIIGVSVGVSVFTLFAVALVVCCCHRRRHRRRRPEDEISVKVDQMPANLAYVLEQNDKIAIISKPDM